jgi:O-methyltransferase
MKLTSEVVQHFKNLFKYFFRRNEWLFRKDYQLTDESLKFAHILEAVNYVKVAGFGGEIPQTYFEFGCHSGRTFSAAARAARFLGGGNFEFYAFDSFEGLPDVTSNEDGIFTKGEFSTSKSDFMKVVEKSSGISLSESSIIKGFYDDSLTLSLQQKLPKIGILHIDVDLYSSTVSVLNFVKPLICPGTVILFDDWYCFPPSKVLGEKKAFIEFLAKYPNIKVEYWKNYSTFGKSFFVIEC